MPQRRFTTISRKPSAMIPRRGLSSASTSGSWLQSNFCLVVLVLPALVSCRETREPILSMPDFCWPLARIFIQPSL